MLRVSGVGWLGLLAVFAAHGAGAAPVTILDEAERETRFDKPVTNAVVCNPYNAEFFRAVAGSDVLAAIDAEAANRDGYWPDLDPGAMVGNCFKAPNYELMVTLEPDVVVMPRNYPWQEAADRLGPFGIPVVVLSGWDVARHGSTVRTIGAMTGHSERAEVVATFHEAVMDRIAEAVADAPRPTVYLEKAPDFYTALVGSGWHDMVDQAGGTNIFADVRIGDQPSSRGSVHQFQIDPEAILERNPEVVVKLIPDSYEPAGSAEMASIHDALMMRAGWDALHAAERGHVYLIGFFAAGASSKMIGVAYMAKWLHPDRLVDLNPDALLKTWLEDFQGVPTPGSYVYGMTR